MKSSIQLCHDHEKPATLICYAEGCGKLICQECSFTHKQIHKQYGGFKIMDFNEAVQLTLKTQRVYSDQLYASITSINEKEFYNEINKKAQQLSNLKQQVRNIFKKYFDELTLLYQDVISKQQEQFLMGLKALKKSIENQYQLSQQHIKVVEQEMTEQNFNFSQSGNITPSKSASQNEIDLKFQTDAISMYENSIQDKKSSHKKNDSTLNQSLTASVLSTIREQDMMKQRIRRYSTQYNQLFEQFKINKFYIDDNLEISMADFMKKTFYVIDNEEKHQIQQQNNALMKESQEQAKDRSLSPLMFSSNMKNSITQLQQKISSNASSQINITEETRKTTYNRLTLSDLEVDTHDHFIMRPFLHSFDIKENQLILYYIGEIDDTIFSKENKKTTRTRFQSNYMAEAKQENPDSNIIPTEIFKNLFKGKVEKKTLLSTFEIPKHHRSIALPNREIYLIGGQYDRDTVPYVFRYDWNQNTLIEAGRPLNLARSRFGIALLSNYIFLIGGYNDRLGALKSCEVLDVVSNQTIQVADLNVEAMDCSVCSYNNRFLYKFGGICADGQLNEYIERYEPSTNEWVSYHISNKNSLRQKFSLYALSGAVQINSNYIMVFGGCDGQLTEDMDQTFLCEVGTDSCRVVGLNKVTIQTKGGFKTNSIIQNNRVYALQLQRDKKGNFHSQKHNLLLYEEKAWKVI